MIDRHERLNGSPVLFSAVLLPARVLLIKAFTLLLSWFHKKIPQYKPPTLKQWQREKITNLGLGTHVVPPKPSPEKDVEFISWHREKITNFGLSKPKVRKKTPTIHQPIQKRTDVGLTPKIAPVQAWKKEDSPAWKNEPNQINVDNDAAKDDFFKILGYD